MAGKTFSYWMIVSLFHFSLAPVTCIQHNTAITSTIPAITKQTSTTAQATSTPTSLTTPSASNIPSIFITLSFATTWKAFCPLSEKFKKKLSTHLIEQDENKVIHVISAARIHYMNVERNCEENSYGSGKEKTKVKLYVSKKGEFGIVDEDMTVKAYRILDDYVVNKKMAEVDAVFADKVQYVSITGSRAPKASERSFTEFDKVAIGIGVCLVVIFIVVMIYRRKKAYLRKSTRRQAEQENRPSEHELQVLKPTEDT